MSAKWTEQQLKAIEEEGGNILVSAAAGSGKTAVLIERILRIIKEKTDIDKMLIVTFTNAAATEMRDRLYLSLQKELDSPDISQEMAIRLSRQQLLLSKSYITTIHAFCQNVIKSNTVESGIDTSFRIGDTGEIQMLKSDTMEKVVEQRYASKNERFLRLVEIYSDYRSDKGLVDIIFSLYEFAQSSPNPNKWLESQKDAFNPELVKDFSQTKWFEEIIKEIRVAFLSYYEKFLSLYDMAQRHDIVEYIEPLEKSVLEVRKFNEYIQKLFEADKESLKWHDIFSSFESLEFVKLPTMSAKRKQAYDEYTLDIIARIQKERKDVLNLINQFFKEKMGTNAHAPLNDIVVLQKDVEELIDVTLDFARAYEQEKLEKHILDFNDLEHIAFKTLSKEDENGNIIKSDIAKRYSEYFEEVYIDEYQDTNELQEAILTLVSRNGTEKMPNTFKVGDVKQSIYGFRQARPDIFIDKFKKYGADGKRDKLIILNKNFRSRDSVLQSVNNVFSNIMTVNTCSVEYNEDEYLNFGASYYPKTESDTSTEIHLCRVDGENKEKDYEAKIVAQIIDKLIKDKYQVYDKDIGKMRDITFKDIVILVRAGKNAKLYTQKMEELGIPAYFNESGGFFENAEINIMLSFMKVVDNPLQDIHLVATMRNIYGFTDTQLAQIKNNANTRKSSGKYFYQHCNEFDGDEELRNKLDVFLKRLNELKSLSMHLSVSELLWIMMHENHFCENLLNGPLSQLHMANINVLYSKAIGYDEGTNKGLFRFLYYFDNLRKRKNDLSEAAAFSENMNVVRIMTIHKSKGLEFPVVILAETGKKFNEMDSKQLLMKHRLVGLGPTCYIEEEKLKYPSVMRYCVSKRIKSDNIAEEMRVLYVAMTRASEKLIITGAISKEFEEYIEECKDKCSAITRKPLEYHVLNSQKYIDWLMMCPTVDEKHIFLHDENEAVSDILNEGDSIQETSIGILPQPEMTFFKEIQETNCTAIPAKISVSDLKRLFDEEHELIPNKEVKMNDLPSFNEKIRDNKTKLSAAQYGTAIHTCLQITDYSRIKTLKQGEALNYAEEVLLNAVDKGFLDNEEAKLIDVSNIARFYESRLARKIANADEIMKEIPFTQLENINGQETAVQGVIDLLIREDESYTVIDFKTDEKIDAEKHRQQLYYYGNCIKNVFGNEPEKIVYFIKHDKEVLL